MVECEDEWPEPKPICPIYTIAHILHRSGSPMKRPAARPVFSLLLLAVLAGTFGFRVAIRSGLGSIYGVDPGYEPSTKESWPLDFALFNSTLLKLAEVEPGEARLRQEITELLEGNFGNPARLRTFATWRRFFNSAGPDMRARTARGMPVGIRSPAFRRVWVEFRRALSEWSRKKRFEPNIMEELIQSVKLPIDNDDKKYSSCAVVGNSGILLTKELGELIDSHEAVIRLNNARIEPYKKNVGSKTTISFVNSNIVHLCARRSDCFCHPYGPHVPIVMYMCQPLQFLDYVVCNATHKSPLIVTDPRFDVLCTRIIKYYSLKRFALGGKSHDKNMTFEQWNSSHDGSMFHYSSGMQAVMLALGVCDRVSLFGFGKSSLAKHHYHTNQKAELNLHDYEAEYEFYSDLVERPNVIPFIPRGFKFPPVVIHR